MSGLLHSRKFYLACWGLLQTIVLHYLSVPADIIAMADALVAILIGSIAYEDGAQKSASPPPMVQTVVTPAGEAGGAAPKVTQTVVNPPEQAP